MRSFRGSSGVRRAPTVARSIINRNPRGVTLSEGEGPTKNNYPTVELSNVVLDLDAEGSPHVRPFSLRDGVKQEAKWRYNPVIYEVKSQVSVLRSEISEDEQAMGEMVSKTFSVWQISDHDVLSVALLGGSNITSSLRNSRPLKDGEEPDDWNGSRVTRGSSLYQALRNNGIPERILAQDANKVIPFMQHRQQLAASTLEDSSSVAPKGVIDPNTFESAVAQCTNLTELRRLCARVTNPSSGLGELSRTSLEHVSGRCRRLASTEPKSDILKFVNNITIQRLATNRDLSASMSLLGLAISSHLALPSCLQYLQICLAHGFIGNNESTGISETSATEEESTSLIEIGEGILNALKQGQGTATGTRAQLFTLLAGVESQPALFELRLIGEHRRIFHVHARLLGELGALRLLWHHWRGQDEKVLVESFFRCAAVLGGAEGAAIDTETATGDLEKDAELDLRTINGLDAYRRSPKFKMLSEARLSPSDFEQRISSVEVWEAFQSADIFEAMRRLNELMLRAAL